MGHDWPFLSQSHTAQEQGYYKLSNVNATLYKKLQGVCSAARPSMTGPILLGWRYSDMFLKTNPKPSTAYDGED